MVAPSRVLALFLLGLLYAAPSTGRAQGFDWFMGDQKSGTGKFIFGTITRQSNGNISGTGIAYRHNNRPYTLQGNENTKVFTFTYVEDGKRKNTKIRISDLRKRTVSTYRGSFTSSGPYQFGAIQK